MKVILMDKRMTTIHKIVLVCIAKIQKEPRQPYLRVLVEELPQIDYGLISSAINSLKLKKMIHAQYCPTFFRDIYSITEYGEEIMSEIKEELLANVQEDSVEEEYANISGQSYNQFESERCVVT